MGVEVVGYETVPSSTEAEKTVLHENGMNEHIKFGSHENGSVKGEANQVPSANFPSNAADEWPEPPQVHSFYFIRWKSHEDPKTRSKIDYADKEIARLRNTEFQLKDKLRQKRSERREIIGELKPLNEKNRGFKKVLDEKKDKLGDLQEKLGELRTATGRGSGLCSSEKELNDMIRSLNYRIQHESIPLTEEKQILREIKQLESTRSKVIDLAAKRAQIQEQLHKDGVEDEVKSISVSLDEVRKDQQPLWERINTLQRPLKQLEEEIATLEADVEVVLEKKRKVNADYEELMKLRWKGNQDFNDSRSVIFKAKEHAVNRDVRALQELSLLKVEEFMSKWLADKSFREDYQKRLLQSLDARQMSKDGRTRNPGEKPLVVVEVVSTPPPKTTETVAKLKAEKEIPATTKVQTKKADAESKDKEDTGSRKPAANDTSLGKSEVDVEKLKEMKREEQIAKAKQALERKKKLAEKNAAKAAVKAQKEAEKKLKEQEKKAAKKKGATSTTTAVNSEEQTDEGVEAAEKVDAAPEAAAAAAVAEKKVVHKEKTSSSVKYRGGKPRESIQKIIPKRKKSSNYYGVWGASAAAAVALLLILVAVGYYYYLL